MARVLGLIALLYSVLLSGVAAAVTPVTEYRILAPQYNFDSGYVGSASSACNSLAGVVGTIAGISTIGDVGGGYCTVWPSNRFSSYGSWIIGEAISCPDGSSASGGSCACNEGYTETDGACKKPSTCPAGQHEEGGACVPNNCKANETRVNGLCVPEPPCPAGETRVNGVCVKDKCPKAGTLASYGWEMSSPSTEFVCESTGVSFDGPVQYCLIRVTNDMDMVFDGKTFYTGTGRYTGGQCNGGSGSGPSGGGTGGGSGGTGGGTGGGGGSGGSGPKPPDPDKPVPPPPPPVPPNPDNTCPSGTVRYSNGNCYAPTPPPKPPNNDGVCPTGTVKIGSSCISPSPPGKPNPDGGGGGGTGGGGGDGEGDGDKSAFGGACGSGFSCEGDAIQCAIAREQHQRACKLFDQSSPESILYDTNKGKEGNQTGNLPGNETINMSGRIDTSDALGAGSAGVSDLSVTVWGRSITLPFSMLNPYLEALGKVLLAVSFLIALRIVARG